MEVRGEVDVHARPAFAGTSVAMLSLLYICRCDLVCAPDANGGSVLGNGVEVVAIVVVHRSIICSI